MVRTLLVRGMLVGIVAGLLSFGFLKVYGEPQVDRAIAFETSRDEAEAAAEKAKGPHMHMSDEDEPELVSRPVQAGLACSPPSWSTAWRSAAYSASHSPSHTGDFPARLRRRRWRHCSRPRASSRLSDPNLKYPANPPSVGDPETIGARTALYFVMIVISLAAMVGAAALKRLFADRLGEWNANLAVAACYIVIVAVAALLLPAVNEVPDEFPAWCCGSSASLRSARNSSCGRRLAYCSAR